MAFTIGDIRFLDRFAFPNESFDKLVQNLYDEDNDNKFYSL